MSGDPGLSRRLARHAARTRPADLPAAALAAARRSLVDAVAVTLATGRWGGEAQAFVEVAREAGHGPCTVIGRGFATSAVMAAFANGAMAHVLDFEDTHDPTLMHPHAAVVPAALAAAESRGGVSGGDLLAAIAVGADLGCRIARGIEGDPAQGSWYLLPMIGAYGAAAAAGHVLGLDEQQMVDALSLASCQATYSAELKRSPASHLRGVRDAYGASAGVTGALLALKGARGYDRPLEGEAGFYAMHGHRCDEAAALDGLGTRHFGAEVGFKPWPSCRGTHAHVAAMLHLREHEGLRAADVQSLHAVVAPVWRMLCEPAAQKREPRAVIDAKFSLPFTLALALVRGTLRLQDFSPESLQDPEVLALAAKLTWEVHPAWTFADATRGTLVVRTTAGRRLEHHVDAPPGDPALPLSPAQTREKFLACAADAEVPVSPAAAAEFLRRCERLEEIDDVRALLPVLS